MSGLLATPARLRAHPSATVAALEMALNEWMAERGHRDMLSMLQARTEKTETEQRIVKTCFRFPSRVRGPCEQVLGDESWKTAPRPTSLAALADLALHILAKVPAPTWVDPVHASLICVNRASMQSLFQIGCVYPYMYTLV